MDWFDKLPVGVQAILIMWSVVFWGIVGITPLIVIFTLITKWLDKHYPLDKKKEN